MPATLDVLPVCLTIRFLIVLAAGMSLGGCTRLTPGEQCEAKGAVLAADAGDAVRCVAFDAHDGCHGDMECILGNDCVHEAKHKLLISRLNVGGWRLFDTAAERQTRIARVYEEIHKCRFGAEHFRGMKSDDGK